MKVVISAVAIVILVASLGAQSVLANQSNTDCNDTCQEAGIGGDSLDRPCTFGPDHD